MPEVQSRLSVSVRRYLLAAVGMVVAVAASWRPGLLPAKAVGYRLELHLPGWILAALAVALCAACLAISSSLLASPRRKDPEDFEFEPPPPPRLSPAFFVLLFLFMAIAAACAFFLLQMVQVQHAMRTVGTTLGLHAPGSRPAAPPAQPHGAIHAAMADWGLTLTIAVLAAIIIGFASLVIVANQPWYTFMEWFRRHRRRKILIADLRSAVSGGIQDLEIGNDPRRAVIACYRRCETVIAARRRRRYAAETPREFVADALATLELPVEAAQSLLNVFERARYSDISITRADRDTALQALNEIRSALAAKVV